MDTLCVVKGVRLGICLADERFSLLSILSRSSYNIASMARPLRCSFVVAVSPLSMQHPLRSSMVLWLWPFVYLGTLVVGNTVCRYLFALVLGIGHSIYSASFFGILMSSGCLLSGMCCRFSDLGMPSSPLFPLSCFHLHLPLDTSL